MENLQVKVTLMKDGNTLLEVNERTLQDAATLMMALRGTGVVIMVEPISAK